MTTTPHAHETLIREARTAAILALEHLDHLLAPGYFRTDDERGCALVNAEAELESGAKAIEAVRKARIAEAKAAAAPPTLPMFPGLLEVAPDARAALPPVPEGHVARCSSAKCGARIVWLEKPDGKAHPVDAHTVKAGDRDYDRTLGHVSHFTTCPDRERFTSKGRK